MKLVMDDRALMVKVLGAFHLATSDALGEARRIAPHVTGRYRDSLRLGAAATVGTRISVNLGSPLKSAKAKEKGAYIEARNADYLAIPMPDGTMRKVKAVRLPARPVVGKVAPKFEAMLTRRLREAL